MDQDPDYASYTWNELLDVRDHINREKYSERARKLDEEIARRSTQQMPERPPEQPLEQPPELSLVFNGSAREYFRIWIVNLCLTLLTFGIFSAWAKVRKKRYVYSHTTLEGTPFQYLGQPVPILKGRLVAGIGFLVYYLSSHFVTFLLPYVLGAGLVAAPWVLARSVAFNARYSAFRNMTFHFDGTYLDALKVLYAWAIIPAFIMSMMFNWSGRPIVFGIASAAFGLSFPWLIKRLKKFIIEHTSYGGKKGSFSATGGQFFGIYFRSSLITLAMLIPVGVLIWLLDVVTKEAGFLAYAGAVPMYAGYVLAFAYVQSRSGNLVWSRTRLGPLRFHSTLQWRDLIKLYVTNAVGIVASLGLLIPWAVMRTLKYRADNMHVLLDGELAEFRGSDRSTVAALGAETIDFFDVDLSL